MDLDKKKARLLKRKQDLVQGLKRNFPVSVPTMVGSLLARRIRRILKIESALAAIERQETRSI